MQLKSPIISATASGAAALALESCCLVHSGSVKALAVLSVMSFCAKCSSTLWVLLSSRVLLLLLLSAVVVDIRMVLGVVGPGVERPSPPPGTTVCDRSPRGSETSATKLQSVRTCMQRVRLFSISSQILLRYSDPVNVVFDNTNKQFSECEPITQLVQKHRMQHALPMAVISRLAFRSKFNTVGAL